jgi:hypothetical protein
MRSGDDRDKGMTVVLTKRKMSAGARVTSEICGSGLTSIHIHSSVDVICQGCFDEANRDLNLQTLNGFQLLLLSLQYKKS